MSAVYQWPIAFVKHWIMPPSYVVGVAYDGRIVNPAHQHISANIGRGVITVIAWFSEPVVEIRGFSQINRFSGPVYTDPLVVIPDYPVLGIFLDIRIRP
jgi:hypothetical protein